MTPDNKKNVTKFLLEAFEGKIMNGCGKNESSQPNGAFKWFFNRNFR